MLTVSYQFEFQYSYDTAGKLFPRLEFQVSDQGVPCPAECAERRPLEAPDSENLQPGGLGVQLMYEVFDDVRFCPGVTAGNCVTMKLMRTKRGT